MGLKINELSDGLVQLAIVLSLLRTDINVFHSHFNDYPEVQEAIQGPVLGLTQTQLPNFNSHVSGHYQFSKGLITNSYTSLFNTFHHSYSHQQSSSHHTVDITAWLVSSDDPHPTITSSDLPNSTVTISVPEQISSLSHNNVTEQDSMLTNDNLTEQISNYSYQNDLGENSFLSYDNEVMPTNSQYDVTVIVTDENSSPNFLPTDVSMIQSLNNDSIHVPETPNIFNVDSVFSLLSDQDFPQQYLNHLPNGEEDVFFPEDPSDYSDINKTALPSTTFNYSDPLSPCSSGYGGSSEYSHTSNFTSISNYTFNQLDGLTQEDMDLIDVLWRQDMDMGISREQFDLSLRKPSDLQTHIDDLKEIDCKTHIKETIHDIEDSATDMKPNISYIIDGETGELIPVLDTKKLEPDSTTTQCQQSQNDSNPSIGIQYETPYVDEEMHVFDRAAQPIKDAASKVIQNDNRTRYPHVQNTPNSNSTINNIEEQWFDLASMLNLNITNAQNQAEKVGNIPDEGVLIQNATLPVPASNSSAFTSEIHVTPQINHSGSALNDIVQEIVPDNSAYSPTHCNQPPAPSNQLSAGTGGAGSTQSDEAVVPNNCFNSLNNILLDLDTKDLLFPPNANSNNATFNPANHNNSVLLCDLVGAELMNCSDDVSMMSNYSPDLVSNSASEETGQYNRTSANCSGSRKNTNKNTNENRSQFNGNNSVLDYSMYSKQSTPIPGATFLPDGVTLHISPYNSGVTEPPINDPGSNSPSSSSSSMSTASPPSDYPHPSTAYYRRAPHYPSPASPSAFSTTDSNISSNDSDPCFTGTNYDDHIAHNHSYADHLHPSATDAPLTEPVPHTDAEQREQRSRDERKARALKVPLSIDEIVASPVERFNELLQRRTLNEAQLQLVRDIRRRGKNKVAAQNCRRRKLQLLQGLEESVTALRTQRDRLRHERRALRAQRAELRERFGEAYERVFHALRDERGAAYDPAAYALEQTADGNVFLIQRTNRAEQGAAAATTTTTAATAMRPELTQHQQQPHYDDEPLSDYSSEHDPSTRP